MKYDGDINYLAVLQELGIPVRITEEGFVLGDCEHGLSAHLCMGPNHYPTDEQEARGELYP